MSHYQIVLPGKRLLDGDAINLLANLNGYASTTNITAHPGGGRTAAFQLNYGLNLITTTAGIADSVVAPSAQPGDIVFITNNGAAAAQIFAQSGDTIDAISGSIGISLASGASTLLMCPQRRKWFSISASGGGVATAVQIATPSTGDTVEMDASAGALYVNTAALNALTILLPAAPRDSLLVELCFAATITTLAIQDASAVTVPTAPTSAFGSGAAIQMRYINSGIGWVYWK